MGSSDRIGAPSRGRSRALSGAPSSRPTGNRFTKGRSGNPSGRPKRKAEPAASAFDIIIDKKLTITQGGSTREVSVDEALQHKIYQDAIAGNKPARRAVMKMIEKRERAREASEPPRTGVTVLQIEPVDPNNANEALIILGIAQAIKESGEVRLKLLPWAVQAALSRRRGRPITSKDIGEAKLRTLDPQEVKWPQGSEW